MRMAYLVLGNACYIVLGILCNADAIFGTYNKKGCHYCFYHDQGGCHSCYLFFGAIGRLILLLFIVSSEVYLDIRATYNLDQVIIWITFVTDDSHPIFHLVEYPT